MFEIKTMNNIAQQGLDELAAHKLTVNVDAENPDGLLIRSAKLHDAVFGDHLLAIARAGVGTDNVPVARCTEQGIAVFNTAGANAEAVKELALCALLLGSRDIVGGIDWVKGMQGQTGIAATVEKGKSAYVGPEINGKTLGIIGLGAIGSLVANAATELGMTVYGYDPYMSVDAAWRLKSVVQHADDLDTIFRVSDYIMVQVHCNDETRGMLGAEQFAKMKQGVRIINESRAEVVDDDAMLEALASGKVGKYITDFPNKKLIGVENVICMPHLGACTPESEERSSVMAAHEMYDYLVNGNIKNSVNFPDATLERMGTSRLCILHFNKPTMLNQFLQIACSTGLNVENMINKAYRDYAYAMIDLNGELSKEQVDALKSIPDVIRVRVV